VKELATRAVERALLFVGRRMWGVGAVIFPVIVRNFGPVGAVRWFARNLPPYERAIRDIGGLRTNLLCCVASMLNGCAYCTYACGRAFQLYYFREHDRLFPLDDHEIVALVQLPDGESCARFEAALAESGLDAEIPLIRRLYAIKLEGAPASMPDEAFIVHAIQMFDDLNFCSIDDQVPVDEAHDRINRDVTLKDRYAKARLAQRRKAE
jgi:hypothetical protein